MEVWDEVAIVKSNLQTEIRINPKRNKKQHEQIAIKLLIDIQGKDQLRRKDVTTRQPVTPVVISTTIIVLDIVLTMSM